MVRGGRVGVAVALPLSSNILPRNIERSSGLRAQLAPSHHHVASWQLVGKLTAAASAEKVSGT